MSTILITGAGGFIGRMVRDRLSPGSVITLGGKSVTISDLILTDRFVPDGMTDRVGERWVEGDLGALPAEQPQMFQQADAVIHLASAVSGECEADLDLGVNSNLLTGVALGRLLAAAPHKPLLVFSSSIAIYGGTPDNPLAEIVTDSTRPAPQNSYGAQKLMLETFYADLARRGDMSIRSLRLMTVSVRPGKPNGAASSFLSGMIREPLQGIAATVPASPSMTVCLNAPETAVSGIIHAMGIDDASWGSPLGMNLPGITVSVDEMMAALKEVGGPAAHDLLTIAPDPTIETIVGSWPSRFDSARAVRLGFATEKPFLEAVRHFAASLK